RFAAARFEATSGAWKFAEEIVLATPCDDAARAEELAFVKAQRNVVKQMRHQRIEYVLSDVQAGLSRVDRPRHLPSLDGYVFELASYQDLETIQLLGDQLRVLVEFLEAEREKRMDTPEGRKLLALMEKQPNFTDQHKSSLFRPMDWSQEQRDLMTLCARVIGTSPHGEAAAKAIEPAYLRVNDAALFSELLNAICSTRDAHAWKVIANRMLNSQAGAIGPTGVNQQVRQLPDPRNADIEGGDSEFFVARMLQFWADPKTALEYIVPIAREKPKDPKLRLSEGVLQQLTGDLEGALETIDIALESESANPFYLVCKAQVLFELRRFEEAKAVAEEASALVGDFWT
ncbi:MAG: hypothetical protein KDB07_11390, partial [Planctomycetes bacterium]|nr:hypothetical protein [Planctomycetota bacterium]